MVKEAPRTPTSTTRDAKAIGRTIDVWAVQCGKCLKWRKIPSQDEFEEIRSKFNDDPFYCNRNPNISCDVPADIEYDTTRTWAVDKPNTPKTPVGFNRRLVMRRDFSKVDVYFQAPTGKQLRCTSEVASYLEKNPQFKDLDASQFSFKSPKVVEQKEQKTPAGLKRKAVTAVVE